MKLGVKIALGMLFAIGSGSLITAATINNASGESETIETVDEDTPVALAQKQGRTLTKASTGRDPVIIPSQNKETKVKYEKRDPSVSGMVDDMCKWDYDDYFSNAINKETKEWYDGICADYRTNWHIRYLEDKQSN